MSIWTKCGKGHDLTAPNAYVQTKPDGTRGCRACMVEALPPSKRKKHSDFADKPWGQR